MNTDGPLGARLVVDVQLMQTTIHKIAFDREGKRARAHVTSAFPGGWESRE
jgi:hypothetical protein